MKHGDEMGRSDERGLLRHYLLGTLSDESARSQIEERLIADDEYAEQISAAEDELIEEFLDGELTDDERDLFNKFFLAPPERRRHLRLTQDLRRLSAESASSVLHRQRSLTIGTPLRGWLRFSLVGAALLIAVFTVWRFAIYKSDTERGIEQLQAAYRDQRPVESRTAEFGAYAPFSETRGAGSAVTDEAALERADRYLLDAASDPNNVAAHRARAVFFLAQRDYDRAIRETDTALQAAPNDARVQSDAGAVYYEAAKNAQGDSAKQLALLDKSLGHLQRAIELDPKLPEARFNLALSLEAMTNLEQAKTAWREYLDLDPNSRWSDEARQHLQRLEKETPTDRPAVEVESEFLEAFRNGDRDKARDILTGSREAVREKYVPQRLAISLTTAEPDRRDELLGALKFAGEIELERTGDGFAKDIALYYSSADDRRLALARDAEQAVRDGYAHCLASRYEPCLDSFQTARNFFEQAGDEPEMYLAQYFSGYARLNTEDHAGALDVIRGVADHARSRGYRWLEMTAMNWVGGCLVALKRNTEALAAFERALTLSREANDSYAMDRSLNWMAELESYARQDSKALSYTFEYLRLSSAPSMSMRQRYRDLAAALPFLSRARLYNAARFVSLETIAAADLLQNTEWMAQSRGYAGVAFEEAGKLERAKELLDEGRSYAESIGDEKTRQKVIAFTKLRSGDVAYAAGDYAAAEQFYSQSAALYDAEIEIPLNREEAHIGVLRSDLALGKTDELEEQIPINIQLAEKSRNGIRDEARRTGFFDSRVNVYDIASEFELSRGNAAAAYDFAESSSSRSLLDHMLSGLDRQNTADGERELLGGGAPPLKLAEIRTQMPADAQIMQYSVFGDKLVIWLLTREAFEYFTVPTRSADLTEKIAEYDAIVSKPEADQAQERSGARELFDLLIAPAYSRLDPGRPLCIVPSRALFKVPFAALMSADGERLVKRFSFVYAPSANVFVTASSLAERKQSTNRDESLLAVGDPAFDQGRHPDLPPLADASAEVQKVSQIYGPQSRSLTGQGATKAAFIGAIAQSDVVHFAGHYVAQPASPMASYLLFSAPRDREEDDQLTNIELARMSLGRTRLVVLAACDTGAETWYEGEGMIGAARSLLAAGVPLVVATQWSVDSAATSDLMTTFHRLRHQHQSTAAALRHAQIAMIDDQVSGHSAPYYWAGFGAYGGSANF
jgi:CHAT domain-containing protein